MSVSIPSPLRILGLARILAGAWFIASGAATLRQRTYLIPQAKRLFGGDIGATDAPVRALIVLMAAVMLVLVGLVLIVKGIGWIRRLLSDELEEMPWWRRDILDRGVRALVRACGGALVLAGCCLALPWFTADDLLGPFPAGFVTVLPLVTAVWAVLGLMLLGSDGPRIEPFEWRLPARAGSSQAPGDGPIIESRPRLLQRMPDAVGLALGAVGVLVQCLMLSWWDLSPLGFPLVATSIIRHTGSIAGGILFFVLGDRMLTAAAELLLRFRYESLLILIDGTRDGMVARAAALRTESRGLTGSRYILAAVGGPHVRESALSTIAMAGYPV